MARQTINRRGFVAQRRLEGAGDWEWRLRRGFAVEATGKGYGDWEWRVKTRGTKSRSSFTTGVQREREEPLPQGKAVQRIAESLRIKVECLDKLECLEDDVEMTVTSVKKPRRTMRQAQVVRRGSAMVMKVEVDVSSRKCDADVDALAARLEREGLGIWTRVTLVKPEAQANEPVLGQIVRKAVKVELVEGGETAGHVEQRRLRIEASPTTTTLRKWVQRAVQRAMLTAQLREAGGDVSRQGCSVTADSNDANCGPRGNADEQPGQTVTSLEAPNTPRQTRQSIESTACVKDLVYRGVTLKLKEVKIVVKDCRKRRKTRQLHFSTTDPETDSDGYREEREEARRSRPRKRRQPKRVAKRQCKSARSPSPLVPSAQGSSSSSRHSTSSDGTERLLQPPRPRWHDDISSHTDDDDGVRVTIPRTPTNTPLHGEARPTLKEQLSGCLLHMLRLHPPDQPFNLPFDNSDRMLCWTGRTCDRHRPVAASAARESDEESVELTANHNPKRPYVTIEGRKVQVEDDRQWTADYVAPRLPRKYRDGSTRNASYFLSRQKKFARGAAFPRWKAYYGQTAHVRATRCRNKSKNILQWAKAWRVSGTHFMRQMEAATDQVFDVTQRLQQKAQQAHRARRQLWLRMVRQKRIHTALLTEASQLRRELRLHRLAAS